jgi:hypothetical protein
VDGTVFFAFWTVSFHSATASEPTETWHVYRLGWGGGSLPMVWPGPAQRTVNCDTVESCRASCPGFVECAADGEYYCCDPAASCSAQHACASNPGLLGCACGVAPPDCADANSCRKECPGFVQCPTDGWFYCCASPDCPHTHACAGNPGLEACACGPAQSNASSVGAGAGSHHGGGGRSSSGFR